jgi:hypothetical protein
MDKPEDYRRLVQDVIYEYGNHKSHFPEIETEFIFDTVRDHYQLMRVGWREKKRTHGCIVHIDIKDGKFWIQHDGTEIGLANELVEKGVPKEDIVLAFLSPSMRKHSEFTVN